jgi:hypothetical protein
MHHNRAAPNGRAKPSKPKSTTNKATGKPSTPSDKMQAGGRIQACTCRINVSGATVRLTFSTPVVVTGSLDLQAAGPQLVSQQQIDLCTWLLTYNVAVVNADYNGLAEGNGIVSPFNGAHFSGVKAGVFD